MLRHSPKLNPCVRTEIPHICHVSICACADILNKRNNAINCMSCCLSVLSFRLHKVPTLCAWGWCFIWSLSHYSWDKKRKKGVERIKYDSPYILFRPLSSLSYLYITRAIDSTSLNNALNEQWFSCCVTSSESFSDVRCRAVARAMGLLLSEGYATRQTCQGLRGSRPSSHRGVTLVCEVHRNTTLGLDSE